MSNRVQCASNHALHQPLLPFTHGNGHLSHGADWTSILLDFSWATSLCSLWTLILNGSTSIFCHPFPPPILSTVFTTHGLPHKVVSDNGLSFTSEDFRAYMSNNGIFHVTTAPYHPASNGLVERAVQTFKRGFKATKGNTTKETLDYRITPHTTTGVAPAQLLMNRQLRSRFDRLFLDLQGCVQ